MIMMVQLYHTVQIQCVSMIVGLSVALSTQLNVCQFWKPSTDRIQFDIMNVLPQLNSHDCGLYAIAFATELSFGYDPVLCDLVTEAAAMRLHLTRCFERGEMERFPCNDTRSVQFGRRVRKSLGVDIYCSCRLPNAPARSMIFCNQCRKWFHTQCENVDEAPKSTKWMCTSCQAFTDTLKRDIMHHYCTSHYVNNHPLPIGLWFSTYNIYRVAAILIIIIMTLYELCMCTRDREISIS